MTPVETLKNNHIEIETQIILHITKTHPQNRVLVKTQNVDVLLVYILYHMLYMDKRKEIFIETGNIVNNTFRQINVRNIFNKLSSELILSLSGWFAFTGCWYEPSFYGKGRKTSYRALKQNEQFQDAFSHLGSELMAMDRVIDYLQHFVCKMYKTNENQVNKARAQMFLAAYRSGNGTSLDLKRKGKNSHLLMSKNPFYFFNS